MKQTNIVAAGMMLASMVVPLESAQDVATLRVDARGDLLKFCARVAIGTAHLASASVMARP